MRGPDYRYAFVVANGLAAYGLWIQSVDVTPSPLALSLSSVLLTPTPLQETQQAAQALMNRPAQSGSAAAQSGRPAVIAPGDVIARQVCPPQRSNQRY